MSQINYTYIKNNIFKLMQFSLIYSHKPFAEYPVLHQRCLRFPEASHLFFFFFNISWLPTELNFFLHFLLLDCFYSTEHAFVLQG